MTSKFARFIRFLVRGSSRVDLMESELDALRSRMDVPDELLNEFNAARESSDYQSVFDDPEPLVTICIGTYNRAELLTTRSIPSALGQTYSNVEVVVVGDGCTDETTELVAKIQDPRLRFVNLSQRGDYPQDAMRRWMVAGTAPFNAALDMAQGQFITHLDDDDEYVPNRVELLLKHLQEKRCDLVYHGFWTERVRGRWIVKNASEFRKGEVTTSSILYHRWFARIQWDIEAYKYNEPGDWNRLRKFAYLGARTTSLSKPLLRHFVERAQRN